MAQYTPHTWTTGDTLTAAQLNALEAAAAAAAVKADADAAYDAKGAATSAQTAAVAAAATDATTKASGAQSAAIAAAATDATTKANAAQAAAVQRANHTGTQSADTIIDGTTNKAYTATEKTKLSGIATGATANVVGAAGSGAGNALSANDPTTTNARTPTAHVHTITDLSATGTRDATTFLRGDGTWSTTPAAAGAVDASTTTKGLVQLTGDLAGTATAPTVPGLANKVNTSTYTAGLAAKADTSSLATVATTGAYSDLSGKPVIPAAGAPLLTPTATKTAAYTAAVGELAMMNVAGGATTLTLPTAPADKSQVGFLAVGATTTAPLTVNRGGTDTLGASGATSVSVPLSNEVTVYQYDAANTRWLPVSNVKPLTSLDARFGAKGTNVHDLNTAPYNLKPGDDATSALQTAINAIVATGLSGKIRFSQIGTYTINGAQQTGTFTGTGVDPYTWSGQVVFPATPFASSPGQAITIEGPMTSSTGTLNTGTPTGLILQSNATTGYVFDMIPGFEYANLSSTGIVPVFKDIVLRVPDNQTCGGFNASRAQHAHFEGITSYPTSFTSPTGSLPFITMPALNSNGDTVLRDVYITRWTTAISLSEHCVLDNVLIAYCDTAFLVSGRGGGHRNYFSYVDVEQVNKVIRVASGTVSAAQFWGQLDVQSSSGWKMMLVSDETASGGKVLGRLDVGLVTAGSLGLSGLATGLDVANSGRGQSSGWTTQHPSDTFGRIQGQAMAGVANGAPGYTWPSMHPWRLNGGDVLLAAGSGSSGNMKQNTGQSLTKCLLPVVDARTGGKPRSIEGTFTTPASGSYSFAVVGSCRYNSGVCTWAQIKNGTLWLGAGVAFNTGTGKLSKASVTTNGATVTLRLELVYAGNQVKIIRAFVNGVLQLSYTLTAAESAAVAASTTQPFLEDGLYFADSDTSSTCTNFVVRDLQPDPPYLGSGTVTLVAGTATIADANITAASIVRTFRQTAGGTTGDLSVALTAGTGFALNSSSNTDTSTVYYEIAAY